MLNPEFKRNIWLQFSLHRLIATPVLLAFIFFAALKLGSMQSPASCAYALFVALVWLWGTRQAIASIVDEQRDKTWDQQRMSALSPWDMTWGKLFGATAFNWYAGLLCMLVLLTEHRPLLYLFTTGILMHSLSIAISLYVGVEKAVVQRGGICWFVVLSLLSFITGVAQSTTDIIWWGQPYEHDIFLNVSSLCFAGVGVFAAWRSMCTALQVPTLPWAWPLFAALFSFYCAGFIPEASSRHFIAMGLIVSSTMTYFALFSENHSVSLWQRIIMRGKNGLWRRMFEELPISITSLILTCIGVLVHSIVVTQDAIELNGTEDFLFRFFTNEFANSIIYSSAITLMLVRDILIYLFFAFSPRPKNTTIQALVYIIAINALIPIFAKAIKLEFITRLFMPLLLNNIGTIAIMVFHVLIAASLVIWQWKRNFQKKESHA